MNFETVQIEISEYGVATLTMMRGDKHNALNAELIAELASATTELAENSDVRVVVLAGDGKTFCAG
ncbi:MAG: enoyl-CoA hydratase/isomerase family protein, partial [Rhizobiaceae bacterium]|nr:enoyl-CoA hydratase/isomerase family protein [Rhizobiaceae bacterium]